MAHGNQAAPPPGAAVDARGVPAQDPTVNVIALTNALSKSIRREFKLIVKYQAKLANAESARIDDIHKADEASRSREAIVNAAQQAALAKQVTDTAATLQTTVETQRQSTASELRTALVPIQTRLEELNKALLIGQGEKVGTVDATALAREAAREAAAAVAATQGSRREGYQWVIGTVIAVVALFLTVAYLIISSSHGVTPVNVSLVAPTPTP
jgi:hypothetical protein